MNARTAALPEYAQQNIARRMTLDAYIEIRGKTRQDAAIGEEKQGC
ncbi:hypothetical protein QCE73_04795 [Caballeronia sp. LZ029]|nr:hypothetical protein [Caballeronia sp. LZ029]MDR5742472.1 hypothetical protein [Caballeronia sp. LZ029]